MSQICDFNLICRACLNVGENMKLISREYHEDFDKTIQYVDMIYFVLGYDPSAIEVRRESDPGKICGVCEEKLITAYLFKKQCEESEKFLDGILNVSVKVEEETWAEEWPPKESIVNCSENEMEDLQEGEIKLEDNIEDQETNTFLLENNDPTILMECHQKIKPSVGRKCVKCNMHFPNTTSYQNHRRRCRSVMMVCHLCGKLVLRHLITKHIKAHSAIKETTKDHVCTECGKSFTLRENLKQHLRIHTGDKRFSCEYCDEKFIHWNSRRSHIRTVHTGEKSYECHICKKKFSQSHSRLAHVRTHTGELPHECSYCNKRFATGYVLKNHLVTHTKERNHVCEFCSKAFGTKKSLRNHEQTHTGERNYVCSVCPKAFTQANTLRKHLKTHPDCPMPLPGTILSQKALKKAAIPPNYITNIVNKEEILGASLDEDVSNSDEFQGFD